MESLDEPLILNEYSHSVSCFGFIIPIEKIFGKYHFNFNKYWRYGYREDHSIDIDIDIDEFFQEKNDYSFQSEIIVRANSISLVGCYFSVLIDDPNKEISLREALETMFIGWKYVIMLAIEKGFKIYAMKSPTYRR